MPRKRLPDRRQAETVDLHYGGQRFHLTIGEYDDGRPGEVFLHGATVAWERKFMSNAPHPALVQLFPLADLN